MMKNKNMFFLLLMLWGHLSKKYKSKLIIVFLLAILNSIAELLSIGSVMPFLAVITSPEMIFNLNEAKFIIDLFEIYDKKSLIIFSSILFCITIVFVGITRLLYLWVSNNFTFGVGKYISSEIYRKTLDQPYLLHISRNSSEVVDGITGKINTITHGLIIPVLTLFSSMIILLSIIIVVSFINFKIALEVCLGFSLIYIFVAKITALLRINDSNIIAKEGPKIVKLLNESFNGIREILLNNSQLFFIQKFQSLLTLVNNAQKRNIFISNCPRVFVEMLGYIFLIYFAFSFAIEDEGALIAIPILGTIALAAQRMLPLIQATYSSYIYITHAKYSLIDILILLGQKGIYYSNYKYLKLKFSNTIQFNNINFRYYSENKLVLKNINFKIYKGDRIGIIGSTGSGKSTFVDIFMGLLSPTDGKILIDNNELNNQNVIHWQSNIANVPQYIYLADISIAENIAFGVPYNNIDFEQLEKVIKLVELTSTINSLPLNFNTPVGEKGVKFSGGQIQRIGIARALYKNASILVFDEATSALDNDTENELIDTISQLSSNITVLMIAHRYTSLKRCNKIIELKDGEIVNFYKYDDLKYK